MENSGMSAGAQPQEAMKTTGNSDRVKTVFSKINGIINLVGMILFRLRKIVLAAPVVYYALRIANYNRQHLPAEVGINLLSSGEFAQLVSRDLAVMGPMGLTAACLLLMFCSRKALYPWAISVFTLVLPLLILFTNLYPA